MRTILLGLLLLSATAVLVAPAATASPPCSPHDEHGLVPCAIDQVECWLHPDGTPECPYLK